jgi:hypothetical protein
VLDGCAALVAAVTAYHTELSRELRDDQEVLALLDRFKEITV